MNILRQKIQESNSEINKNRKETEDIIKDNSQYIQLEKRQDELLKEVRNLEGTLADYNLTFDKLRSKTRPEDIKNMYLNKKGSNTLRLKMTDLEISQMIFLWRENLKKKKLK